jgi:ATP-binding cassette subfamily C protein
MSIATENFKESQSSTYAMFNESVENLSTVKVNNLAEYEIAKHTRAVNNYINSFKKIMKFSSTFVSLASSLQIILTMSIFIVGSIFVVNKSLTVGDVITLIGMGSFIISPIFMLLEILSSLPEVNVSYQRLTEILNITHQEEGTIQISDSINNINVRIDSFKYDNNAVLKDFQYRFSKGKLYFLCGQNGIGKSTLLKILSKLYDDYNGAIYINDLYELREIERKSYYRHVAYIEQNPHLFAGTLSDNINYGIDKAKNIWIYEFMKSLTLLPEGLNTLIVDNAVTSISGGEKQKVSIVRGLIKESDIILLDEPTVSLDKKSANDLFEVLNKMKNSHIIILVTHEEKYAKYADEVIHLEDFLASNLIQNCGG